MIPLPRDFQDFLWLLNASHIRYMVIGGYAVAYHGYVRYTGDLDIFVELSVTRMKNMRASGRQKDLADVEALTAKPPKEC